MLTLWELQRIVEKPGQGERIPTAKYLKEGGVPVISEHLGMDAEITVYSNGYVLYQVYRHTTIFPLHSCGDYLYLSGNSGVHMPKSFFEKEPWYIRLILEGEDRMSKNQNKKEQDRTISYSSLSEEWEAVEDLQESVLEVLIRQEMVEEMMHVLTKKQRVVLEAFFFQEKTQKQISKELSLSCSSVYDVISQAIRRIREKYLADERNFKKDGIYLTVSNAKSNQQENKFRKKKINAAGRNR